MSVEFLWGELGHEETQVPGDWKGLLQKHQQTHWDHSCGEENYTYVFLFKSLKLYLKCVI